MHDDILGPLSLDPRLENVWAGSYPFKGGIIKLLVDPEGSDLERALQLARLACKRLLLLDEEARKVAAKELTSTYNDSWRSYMRGDGAEVINPSLTEADLASKLSLCSISIEGPENCSLRYSDNGLFAGHSIFVEYFDGGKFADAWATLYG